MAELEVASFFFQLDWHTDSVPSFVFDRFEILCLFPHIPVSGD